MCQHSAWHIVDAQQMLAHWLEQVGERKHLKKDFGKYEQWHESRKIKFTYQECWQLELGKNEHLEHRIDEVVIKLKELIIHLGGFKTSLLSWPKELSLIQWMWTWRGISVGIPLGSILYSSAFYQWREWSHRRYACQICTWQKSGRDWMTESLKIPKRIQQFSTISWIKHKI